MAKPLAVRDPITKAQRIFLDIRSKILSGEIGPEIQLTLRPIARQYGTGVNAASEAIKALAAEGLVELAGRAGAKVIRRDLSRVRGESILRMAIECEAIRHCAQRADAVQMATLKALAVRVDRLFAAGGPLDECRRVDVQFHLAIAEFAGVPELHTSLVPLLERLVTLDQTAARTPEIPGQKHIEVFEVLESRDPDRASAVMRRHLEHAMSLSLALLYA